MWKCISNLTVDPLTVWLLILPPESTVNSVDCQLPHCWPSTLSLLTVDHRSPHCWPLTLSLLTVDHWSPHYWLLILSLLTVDPPPRINSQQCWSLIADPLTVDCWLSITSLLTVDPLTVDCWSSITSLLTVDPPPWNQQSTVLIVDHLTVDHSPCHCRLLPSPPESTQAIAFLHEIKSCLLILSQSIIDFLPVQVRS